MRDWTDKEIDDAIIAEAIAIIDRKKLLNENLHDYLAYLEKERGGLSTLGQSTYGDNYNPDYDHSVNATEIFNQWAKGQGIDPNTVSDKEYNSLWQEFLDVEIYNIKNHLDLAD